VKAAGIVARRSQLGLGWQTYRGMKLSARAAALTSASTAATRFHACVGTPTTTAFIRSVPGYTDPQHPNADAGYCIRTQPSRDPQRGYQHRIGNGVLPAHHCGAWRVVGFLSMTGAVGGLLSHHDGRHTAPSNNAAFRRAQRRTWWSGPEHLWCRQVRVRVRAPASRLTTYFEYEPRFAQARRTATTGQSSYTTHGRRRARVLASSPGDLEFVSFGKAAPELRLEGLHNLFTHFHWANPVVLHLVDVRQDQRRMPAIRGFCIRDQVRFSRVVATTTGADDSKSAHGVLAGVAGRAGPFDAGCPRKTRKTVRLNRRGILPDGQVRWRRGPAPKRESVSGPGGESAGRSGAVRCKAGGGAADSRSPAAVQ